MSIINAHLIFIFILLLTINVNCCTKNTRSSGTMHFIKFYYIFFFYCTVFVYNCVYTIHHYCMERKNFIYPFPIIEYYLKLIG